MTDSQEKDLTSTIQSIIEDVEKKTGAKITPGPLLKIDDNTTQEDIENHRRKFLQEHAAEQALHEEYRQSLFRAFKDQPPKTYIRMDGWTARDNPFLRDGWNYAIDQGWLRVEEVELEQETFLKGFLTEKGKEEVLNA